LTQELRPPVLAHFGLIQAIHSHVAQVRTLHATPAVEITAPIELSGLSGDVSLALYRIHQQALQNIYQHAGARHAYIRLWGEDGWIWLEIEDDGQGFEAPEHWVELARTGHLGLVGMAERAEAVGGQLAVHSAPGEGTVIRVKVPAESSGPAPVLAH
jgi:signal transduction histidine kinase